MKKITFLALILLVSVSCKKKIKEPEHVERFTIVSTNTSGSYTIKIALPADFDKQHKKYATLYLLDGDQDLNLVSDQCRQLSAKHSTENVLVVSIGYGRDRANDYTPTKAREGDGGAPEFMQFIKNELRPRLEGDYAADTSRNSRVILGHSFGGLFATYAYAKHNEFFGNYLMLSPSLWYDNEVILHYEQDNRSNLINKTQLVFLGIGQLENAGRMQAPFEAFYQILTKNYSSLKLEKNSVAHLDHFGSKNPNILKALDFYFQNR